MENIKEAFGIIDGYELKTLGKLRVKKEELFEDIQKVDSKIIEECQKTLENSGQVFTYEKDKKIKAIYLFEEEKKEEKVLKNTKTVYAEEILEEQRQKFDNRLQEEFKDELLLLEYSKVYINDQVMQIDPTRSKKEIYIALAGGAAIGFMFGWLVFEDITFGILWAIIFAGSFSGLEVVVGKKRGRKKK